MKRIVLQDLSSQLGCSKTLISMVLNGKGNQYGISQKTQATVMEAISRLNYSPDKFARSLSLSKSNFVGLIISDMSNPFNAGVANAIQESLFKRNYNLMVFSSDENEKKENLLVDSMIKRKSADGLIIASTHKSSEFYDQEKFSDMPVVFIDRVLPLRKANYVVIDNYAGSVEIVNCLTKIGCEKIACFVSTPLHISTTEDRLYGYRNAVYKNGLKRREHFIKTIDSNRIEDDVEKSLRELKEAKELVDAFFLLNSKVCLALLKVLKKAEFSMFAKAQLACFEDMEMFNMIDKKIISISQPIEEIGKNAAEIVLELISGKKYNKSSMVLPTTLIER